MLCNEFARCLGLGIVLVAFLKDNKLAAVLDCGGIKRECQLDGAVLRLWRK